MEMQDEYTQKMAAQLIEWGAQINVLEANMKQRCVEQLYDVRLKQRAAFKKMRELGNSSGEAWEQVKEAADKVCDDLKANVADAHSRFKVK